MKSYSTTHALKARIRNKKYNGQTLTNLGSFTRAKSGYMALKSHSNGISMLAKVSSNFGSVTYYPIKYANGAYYGMAHANSITRVGSKYFIATMNDPNVGPAMIKVGKRGKVLAEYPFFTVSGTKSTAWAMDYYGNYGGHDYFFFLTGCEVNGSVKSPHFDFVRLDIDGFRATGIRLTANSPLPVAYVENDITYNPSSRKLYATFFLKEGGHIKKSFVYAYKIDHTNTSHVIDTPKLWMTTSQTGESNHFEVEAFIYNSGKYVVANVGGGKDGIYKLLNK